MKRSIAILVLVALVLTVVGGAIAMQAGGLRVQECYQVPDGFSVVGLVAHGGDGNMFVQKGQFIYEIDRRLIRVDCNTVPGCDRGSSVSGLSYREYHICR